MLVDGRFPGHKCCSDRYASLAPKSNHSSASYDYASVLLSAAGIILISFKLRDEHAQFSYTSCSQTKQEYAPVVGLPTDYDTVVLALANFKLARTRRGGKHSQLVQVLLRNQVLWYILIEAVSVINLIVAYATLAPASSNGRGIVSAVLTALTSISVNDVIF